MPLGAFALKHPAPSPPLRPTPLSLRRAGRRRAIRIIRGPPVCHTRSERRVADVVYLVLLVVGLVTWAAVRWIPARNDLVRVGVGFAVFGALTTMVMWWMVVPEVFLVAGLVMLGVGFSRPATRTA